MQNNSSSTEHTTSLSVLDENNETITTVTKSTQAKGFVARCKKMIPRFQDPKQKKAGGNIIRFFAFILAATILSRGAAGATLPRVKTVKPTEATLGETVDTSAQISTLENTPLKVPENLLITSLLVTAGQKVKEGDSLATFDEKELGETLAREKVKLKEKQVELSAITAGGDTYIPSAGKAQTELERAQQDYNSKKASGEASVAAAETARNNAKSAVEQLQQAFQDAQAADAAPIDESSSSVPPPSETERIQKELEEAKSNLEKKEQELQDAIHLHNQTMIQCDRDIQDKKTGLSDAQTQDGNQQKKHAEDTAKNSVQAENLRLDIAKQSELVDTLATLVENNATLLSPQNGLILNTVAEGTRTDNNFIVQFADTSGGFIATATISKEEAKDMQAGMECEVSAAESLLSYSPATKGTITSITQDNDTKKFTVKIRLASGGDWKQGANARVKIIKNSQSYQTCVPLSALRMDNTGTFVYVIQQKESVLGTQTIAVKVPVSVESKDNTFAAVSGNLFAEDIITSSNKTIEENSPVRVENK